MKPKGEVTSKLDFILLVDDDEDDNEWHVEMLNNLKVAKQTMSIAHPLEALTYFKNCLTENPNTNFPVPSLVFMDVHMPMYTGFELLDYFQELPDPYHRKEKIKFVLMPGSFHPLDAERLPKYHPLVIPLVIATYEKPLTPERIQEIVGTHA
jgi:CheY-like chemotaxis protein